MRNETARLTEEYGGSWGINHTRSAGTAPPYLSRPPIFRICSHT